MIYNVFKMGQTLRSVRVRLKNKMYKKQTTQSTLQLQNTSDF